MVRSLRKPELYKFAVECLRMGSVRKADLKARILSSVLDEVQRIALHSGSTSITLQVSRAEMLRGLQTIMYQQRDSTRGRRARADFSRNFMMDDISRLAGLMGPGGGLSSGLTAPPRLPDRDFICNICHGGCSYPRCPSCGSFTHHACAALFSRYAVRGCLTCRLTQAAKADIYNLNFPRGGVLHHASPLYMVNIDGQISTLRAAGSHAGRILSESIRIPSTDDGRIFLVRPQATLLATMAVRVLWRSFVGFYFFLAFFFLHHECGLIGVGHFFRRLPIQCRSYVVNSIWWHCVTSFVGFYLHGAASSVKCCRFWFVALSGSVH